MNCLVYLGLYQCSGGCGLHHGCGILFIIVEGIQGLAWWFGGIIGFGQRFV